MMLDGPNGEGQALGDLGVREPIAERVEHLHLAGGNSRIPHVSDCKRCGCRTWNSPVRQTRASNDPLRDLAPGIATSGQDVADDVSGDDDGLGVGECEPEAFESEWEPGAATRVAVTALLLIWPPMTAVLPGVNWAAVAGLFLLPNWVCGVMVTVSVWPALVRTVHVEPDSLTIVTLAPLAACFLGPDAGTVVAGDVVDVDATCPACESPEAATAMPTPAPIAATAAAVTIRGVRWRTTHDRLGGM